ncbi:AAA family ATPase [Variovorax sp. VNK109]|uniref:AAA family ATPase n=1 Tax=Variovorax sp. VNK109 TaxID=3400919 RepID=UPI003C027783
MTIEHIAITNFKGIDKETTFQLCPITIFIGANSSGKSSVLHSIAALSQTLKLGNTLPSLVLDSEYAHVHLGRFVEIAHSNSYDDSICIALDLGPIDLEATLPEGEAHIKGPCYVRYEFRCNRRTQEVYISSADFDVGGNTAKIIRSKNSPYKFYCTTNSSDQSFEVERRNNISFMPIISKERGVNQDLLGLFVFLSAVQQKIERALRSTCYLGPFRQSPLRRYPFRGSSASEVGAQGEATITLLASEYSRSKGKAHQKQINGWLASMGLAKAVGLSRVGTSDLLDVTLTLDDGEKLPIADLGYGLSQVLPVLTQCSYATKGSTLLFEQPELHLHEKAAKKLSGIFIESATKRGLQLIIETHSRDLVNGVFDGIRSGSIDANEVALYRVDRIDKASRYKRISINFDGAHLDVDDPWADAVQGTP